MGSANASNLSNMNGPMHNNMSMHSDHHGTGMGGQHFSNPSSSHHSNNPNLNSQKPLGSQGGMIPQGGVGMGGGSAGGISGMSSTNGGQRPTMT